MRFKVPQFIDIEDKIFGPFSFKQFVYLAGGAGLCYIFFKTLPVYISIILILLTAALSLSLTFVKINGKTFIEILQAFLLYLFQSKLYIWMKKPGKTKTPAKEVKKEEAPQVTTKLTENRLRDVAWSLDIL